MTMSYLVRSATTTNPTGHSFTTVGSNDVYGNTPFFLKFNLSGSGLVSSQIASVQLRLNATTVSNGGTTVSLFSSLTGWGGALEATEADFHSTEDNLEESGHDATSTGLHVFSVNKDNLDLDDWNYFKVFDEDANAQDVRNIIWASQNNATASLRPILRVNLVSGSSQAVIF